ncbi:MAG: LapA family protein [Acidobacteriota bacterium]|nr:LapA family protein [Acidobacteriota bacterium]
MRALVLILIAAFVILVLWVALANATQTVTLSLGFGWHGEASLAQVIFGAVLAGVVFTGLLAVIEGLALRVDRRGLQKRLRRLEEEIHDLRNAALHAGGAAAAAAGPPGHDAAVRDHLET